MFIFKLIRFKFRTVLFNINFWLISRRKEMGAVPGLFLDDRLFPEQVTWIKYYLNINWKIVRTYDAFRREIEKGSYKSVSFDTELGGAGEPGGFDCMYWMVNLVNQNKIEEPPVIYIHGTATKNSLGERDLRSYWNAYLASKPQGVPSIPPWLNNNRKY